MLNNEKALVVEFMTKNRKTDLTKAVDKSEISILSAKIHYAGRHISDYELVPFQKAIEELIREGLLVNTKKYDEYFLDLTKM